MKKFIKNYYLIIILLIVCLVFLTVSVFILNQETTCRYTIVETNYEETIEVKFKMNKMVNIHKKYTSDNEEILANEKEENEEAGFKTVLKDKVLTADKNEEETKNYFKLIEEYKENGYICEINI